MLVILKFERGSNMLLAFHNDPKVKAKYVKRLSEHHEADEITRGFYWHKNEHRGCAVGCTVHSNENAHSKYPEKLGIPEQIAYLEDWIFENVPLEDAPKFAVDFLDVIPIGADLSLVMAKFMVWLLVDEVDGVLRFANTDATKKAIQAVANLHGRIIDGGAVSEEEWRSAAARAAYASYTAAYAADTAAYAADAARTAAYAARTAARAAAYAADTADTAAYAARTAARAADATADAAYAADTAADAYYAAADASHAAARAADAAADAWRKMAAKLLELLRSAPTPKVGDWSAVVTGV